MTVTQLRQALEYLESHGEGELKVRTGLFTKDREILLMDIDRVTSYNADAPHKGNRIVMLYGRMVEIWEEDA